MSELKVEEVRPRRRAWLILGLMAAGLLAVLAMAAFGTQRRWPVRPAAAAGDGERVPAARASLWDGVEQPRLIRVDPRPFALVFDGEQLWVSNGERNTVQAVDLAAHSASRSIQVESIPRALAFDGTRLWVAGWGGDALQFIDVATYDASPPVPVGKSPRALAFDGTRLWVANSNGNSVQAIEVYLP